MPDLSIAQPAKVSTPDVAASGLVVQVSVPALGLVPIASVMLALLDVTVLPPASCTDTTGWVANAVAPVPPPGWVVKPSFVAAAGLIVAGWVADVKPPAESVMVGVPATVSP